MRLCELREKDVINICDCKSLGCVTDVELNPCNGTVDAIIVPGPGHIWGVFGTDREYIIPFDCIKQIGKDIILVEICAEKFLQKC